MPRLLAILLVAVSFLAAAPSAEAQRDWRWSVTKTRVGDHIIGNPAAKVKLTQYVSFTCPACRLFSEQSKAKLRDDLVRRGVVQLEIRNVTLNGLDMAAAVTARCVPERSYLSMYDRIYANQSSIIERGQQIRPAFLAGSPTDQVQAYAVQSGLVELAKSEGLTNQVVNACLANRTEIDRLSAATQAAMPRIHGTPGFEINGKVAHDVHNWAALQPLLAAASAK